MVDVSDIFAFFLLGGGERGVRGARGGGVRFLLKIPGEGGFSWGVGVGWARGWEGVCREFGGGGGGVKQFFFGSEIPTKQRAPSQRAPWGFLAFHSSLWIFRDLLSNSILLKNSLECVIWSTLEGCFQDPAIKTVRETGLENNRKETKGRFCKRGGFGECALVPRGPKDQKKIEISSEIEIFERTSHRGPIFCGEIETSRLQFSSEIKSFDGD